MTILLSLLSAAMFGCGVGLQQRPARAVPDSFAARPGLVLRAARRPAWAIGVAAEVVGLALQVAALRKGSLVVVQPLVTTSLLFTLALASAWSGGVTGRDWLGAVMVVVGLSAFMMLASPSDHSSGVAGRNGWLLLGAATGGGVATLLVAGFRAQGRTRAGCFALAAGLGDAAMAVLTKGFAHSLGEGVGHTLRSWTPYVLCGAGIGSLLLSQTAYQTGRPTVSLPIITVTEPIVSSTVGIALFGEAVHLQGVRAPAVVVAAGLMALGLTSLTRSPLVIERRG